MAAVHAFTEDSSTPSTPPDSRADALSGYIHLNQYHICSDIICQCGSILDRAIVAI